MSPWRSGSSKNTISFDKLAVKKGPEFRDSYHQREMTEPFCTSGWRRWLRWFQKIRTLFSSGRHWRFRGLVCWTSGLPLLCTPVGTVLWLLCSSPSTALVAQPKNLVVVDLLEIKIWYINNIDTICYIQRRDDRGWGQNWSENSKIPHSRCGKRSRTPTSPQENIENVKLLKFIILTIYGIPYSLVLLP